MPTIAPITDPAHFRATCPTCRHLFLANTVGKRGTSKTYCSKPCARLGAAWQEFRAAFADVVPAMTLRALFMWRGDLLSLASQRAWNAGLARTVTKDEAIAGEDAVDAALLQAAIEWQRAGKAHGLTSTDT